MLFNQLIFPVPQSTKDFWIAQDADSNADLFDPNLPLLIVPFYPEDFSPTYDREETGFRDGFSSATYLKSAVRYGFELTLRESAIAIYYALKKLQTISEATNPFTGVTLYDYALPEEEDLAQGYTVRVGALEVEVTSGTMRDLAEASSTRRLFGCRLIFKEKEPR